MTNPKGSGGRVRLEREGPIATLLLDHPERRNAISVPMWGELAARCEQLAADPEVRCVIVRGAGDRAFVSGADISEFGSVRASASEEQGYASTAGRGLLALASLEVPTLALIHGFCIGGGVGLSLSCDMRYAAEDAVFAIPAARLGLGYSPQGMQALLHLVGPANTKEIFFTARRYTAPEAYDMGLVSRVFPKADLDAGVAEIADTIAENAPLTVRAAKLAVRESMRDPESRDFTAAHKAVEACFDSDDYREGVRAFLERRSPRFRGR